MSSCSVSKYSRSDVITEFTEGHQYRRTDGLVGTGLMPYKAHSPKYQHFMLFAVPVYSKYEISSLLNYMYHNIQTMNLSTTCYLLLVTCCRRAEKFGEL